MLKSPRSSSSPRSATKTMMSKIKQQQNQNMKRMICIGGIFMYIVGIFSGLFMCHFNQFFVYTTTDSSSFQLQKKYNPSSSSSSSSSSHQHLLRRPFPHELKLPTPIIVMGLMKAGTTSIYGYFQCGLHESARSKLSHYDCKPPKDFDINNANNLDENGEMKIGLACGHRMRRNIEKNKVPAFEKIDDFILYAEIDAQEPNGGMTLPQWKFVKEIHDQYPNATWILNLRDPYAWLQSINRWKDLRQRFIDYPGGIDFPKGVGSTDDEMIQFYNLQAQKIRDFVKDHPSHTLVEVPIDQPNAGQIMEDAFGISSDECWGKRNVNHDGSAKWKLE